MTETSTSSSAPRVVRPAFSERYPGFLPLLLVPLLVVAARFAIPEQSTWLTLTLSGVAIGMTYFIMASGLTLVFGLMDVINFGHGAFVSLGAFVGISVMLAFPEYVLLPVQVPETVQTVALVGAGIGAAMVATAIAGWVFERVIVRPVYGAHLKQILVTVGGLIIAQELITVAWGPEQIFFSRPEILKGAFTWQGAALEKYGLLAVAVGLVVFFLMRMVLRHTKTGLIVRAGVENGEMVKAMGYNLRRVFVVVFVVGSALAGLGGIMWGLYQEAITADMGSHIMVMVFVVVIIGGLGSVEGCFIAALLVGLTQNYVEFFLEPKLALVSSIALMVLILMWRPKGMFPVVRAK